MRVIQISGMARSGKTTLAHIIARKAVDFGLIPVIVPFAGPIKEMAESHGIFKDKDPEKYRLFCQELGASKRKEDENYWVDLVRKNIMGYLDKEQANKDLEKTTWEYLIIQDDVRYTNELAFGREMDAFQIFIKAKNRLTNVDSDWRSHESEKLANDVEQYPDKYNDTFAFTLVNEGDEEDLQEFTDIFFELFVSRVYKCECIGCKEILSTGKMSRVGVADHLFRMYNDKGITEEEKRYLTNPNNGFNDDSDSE